MSLLDSLGQALAHIGALQLGCALVAAMAYVPALDGTLSPRVRAVLAGGALAAATAFAASLPDWPSGVVLALFAIAGLAGLAGLTWLASLALGLDGGAPAAPAAPPRAGSEASDLRTAPALPLPVRST